jgi:hypothetical protein
VVSNQEFWLGMLRGARYLPVGNAVRKVRKVGFKILHPTTGLGNDEQGYHPSCINHLQVA